MCNDKYYPQCHNGYDPHLMATRMKVANVRRLKVLVYTCQLVLGT
jgi:hypothetical protein